MVAFEISRETPVEMSVESVKMVNAPVDLSNYYTKPQTDAAIAEAVGEIELTPGPQGEPGPQGPQGEKGEKGDKGDSPVVSVEKWTFELTDGTIITKDVVIG